MEICSILPTVATLATLKQAIPSDSTIWPGVEPYRNDEMQGGAGGLDNLMGSKIPGQEAGRKDGEES